ncbi:MAG: glycosyltransferase family 4 protein [Pseudomonadota bacterium]
MPEDQPKLRIAQIFSHTMINGVGTSLEVLLRQLNARGHEIMLVHRPDSWLVNQTSDLPLTRLESRLKTRYKELYRVGDSIRNWKADVIHTHGSTAHKYGAIYRVAGKIPIVATAHACHFQLHWIFNNRVIAPSQITADYHHRVNRVSRRNLRIVHHAFDIANAPLATKEDRVQRREELGLPNDAFVLGMTGSICERKNQMACVDVLEKLRQNDVDAHLVLIGEPGQWEYTKGLREHVKQQGLEPYVHLLGVRLDAPALLAALDAYLCTSLHEEGPIATLEAMSAGLPVITTRIGCMPALMADDKGGKMFAPEDIDGMVAFAAELAGDPDLRRRLGTEGHHQVVSQLSPEAVVPQVEAVYREVAKNR